MTQVGIQTTTGPQSMLVFGLAGESFALPVTAIHEVIDPLPITRVPNAAAHAPGLINVRGIVTPVVDIRLRLQIPTNPKVIDGSRLIVLEMPIDGMITRVAISADIVEGVIETDPSMMEDVPDLGARWPPEFIHGVTRHNEKLIVLLYPETLLSSGSNPSQPS